MKPEEPRKDEAEAARKQPPAPETRSERSPDEPQQKPSAYEFKILPANPKNAFDFEDVADK